MELDSFTEGLIERTQARRDYLNKKLSEISQSSARKRRTSDTEENSVPLEVDAHTRQVDESPKRQCLDVSSEADVESADDEDCAENKENLITENDQSNLFVPIHATGTTRGLAALKKSKPLYSEGNELCRPLKDEIKFGSEVPSRAVLISKTLHSTNSRFAALAANIKNWDDDSSNSSSCASSVAVKTASYNKSTPVPVSSNTSISSDSLSGSSSSIALHGENPVPKQCKNGNSKHVTFDLSGNSGDHLVNSQIISNFSKAGKCTYSPQKEPEQYPKSSKEEQQVRKVHVWDQAVLATLESQGFVKSPSRSKLAFNFSPNNKQPNTDVKLTVVENSQDIRNGKLSCQKILEPPGKSTSPVKSVAASKPKQIYGQAAVCVSNISSGDGSKDPAELPLSSRRALFEKAFCGGTRKQVENVCESNLSVAQRAALFEKAAKQNNLPATNKIMHRDPVSPMKTNTSYPLSPLKNVAAKAESSTVKSPFKPNSLPESKSVQSNGKNDSPGRIIGSPVKAQNLTSPLRNIGPHTLLLHERLNSGPDWQNKEIIVKAKEERKSEISALRSHWEKVSSSSVDSNPESVSVNDPNQRNPTSVSSLEEEKCSSVFTEEETSSLEEIPEENDLEDNQCSSSSSSEREWDEEMPSEKYSDNEEEEDEYAESSDITGEAVAVCDEMDELLNEALDPQTSAPSSQSPEKVLQKLQEIASCGSTGPSVSHQSNIEKFSSTPKSSSAVPNYAYSVVSGEASLERTVSSYRKEKQEAKATPVRCIVRRPQVMSPPSPEIDRTLDIQEEIQVLHNEVLTQQNVISQTCQALNFIHSRAEFSGSSEEVEVERLLLIATLKRQACLNEIQRLKTLNHTIVQEGNGTLTINDIRLPLKREFIASQLREESNMVHYFLCMIKHQAQVVFTEMLSTKDGVHGGCFNFSNHINIKNLPADFSVAFEVYTLQMKKEVMPHDKKYHIKREHSKIRLTPKGKKADARLLAPAVSSPGGPCAVRTPSFSIVGFTRFTLKNSDRKNCTLEKVPFTSPLEGILQFNLQLHAEHNISEKGFLTMFEDVSGFGAWHRRWCVLDGGDLAFWKYPDDEKKKEPLGIIDLAQCITPEVRLISRDKCARPNTFHLVTVRPQAKGDKNTLVSRSINTVTSTKYQLSADTKEERILWCQKLNDALTNVRKWNPHALKPMEMKGSDK